MGKWESKIRTNIKEALNRLPKAKFVVNHGNQYAEAGNPDIFGSYRGEVYVFEIKNEEGQISKIQNVRLQEWHESDAICSVVRSIPEALAVISSGTGNFILITRKT
jgi:hypothetical protein